VNSVLNRVGLSNDLPYFYGNSFDTVDNYAIIIKTVRYLRKD
jgi:hypothetical protein